MTSHDIEDNPCPYAVLFKTERYDPGISGHPQSRFIDTFLTFQAKRYNIALSKLNKQSFMSDNRITLIRKIIWAAIFGIAMGFVEAAVVVYLRKIYYPEGFVFPLKPLTDNLIGVEVLREVATIFMLLSIAVLAGKKLWERFAYFIFCFGVWDIFYYVWLKVLINWPLTIFDWDILFLIPLPWIGPVIAPVTISLMMIIFGLIIINIFHKGFEFNPSLISRILTLIGTGFIIFSFIRDTGAILYQQPPQPYWYGFLLAGGLLYAVAFVISYAKTVKQKV